MRHLVAQILATFATTRAWGAPLHPVPVPTGGEIVGEESGASGARWQPTAPLAWGADFPSKAALAVDRAATRQTVIGFGSALTDTAAFNVIRLMNDTTRAEFLVRAWSPLAALHRISSTVAAGGGMGQDGARLDGEPRDSELGRLQVGTACRCDVSRG
jgi:hypothetical protein